MLAARPNPGFDVADLLSSHEFLERRDGIRDGVAALAMAHRLSRLLVEDPGLVLREVVEAALQMCGADSAGISLERFADDGTPMFYWAVVSGAYVPFAEAMLPQAWLPCKVALQEQRPQRVRLSHASLVAHHMDAPPITDGIVLPWNSGGQRGTLWVMAHDRADAFFRDDYLTLEILADFASVAYRNGQEHDVAVRAATVAASSAMAHTLAHHINNPLQSITNSVFLALHSKDDIARLDHMEQASRDLRALSKLVGELLLLHRPEGKPRLQGTLQ